MATRLAPEVGTPYGRYVATQTGNLLQHLVVLDDLWTAELDAASGTGPLPEETTQMLGELVDAMQRDLREVPDRAYEIRLMIDELRSDVVDSTLAKILETGRVITLEARLQDELPDYELRGAIITACDYLRERGRVEEDEISGKIRRIQIGGEVPEGDLSRPFRCAALLVLVGAGVAATIGLGGAPVFVGLGTFSQVGLGVMGWVDGKCSRELPRISFERR